MNDKITQAFIDALTAQVPDGWRLIDYKPCPAGHDRLSSCGKDVVTSTNFAITNNCLLVERIPLTGRAWVEANLVTRPWSVVRCGGVTFVVTPYGREVKLHSSTHDNYCVYGNGSWQYKNDAPIPDDMSDETVEWLYQADRTVDND